MHTDPTGKAVDTRRRFKTKEDTLTAIQLIVECDLIKYESYDVVEYTEFNEPFPTL